MTKIAKWAFEKPEDAKVFVKDNEGKVANFEDAMKTTYEDMYTDTKMIRAKKAEMKKKMEQEKSLKNPVGPEGADGSAPGVPRPGFLGESNARLQTNLSQHPGGGHVLAAATAWAGEPPEKSAPLAEVPGVRHVRGKIP